MSVATDIALILACLAIIIKYTVKGLAKVVLGVVAFIGSITVAWLITPIFFKDSSFLVRSIANVLAFLVVYIILTVVFSAVNKIFKLPILGGINTFLGFLLGVVCAYILGSYICSALSIIIHFAGGVGDMDNSFMYQFFSECGAVALIDKIFIK